jgi:hypothetical protein
LDVKIWQLQGGELHKAIQGLVSCFTFNNQLNLPTINYGPVLSNYAKQLALTGQSRHFMGWDYTLLTLRNRHHIKAR